MQPAYHKPSYWDTRYTEHPEPLEWYQNYNSLKSHIQSHVYPLHSVLHVGCGNSSLPLEMEKDGYKRIHNIDISAVLIERMIEEMGEGRGGIEWQVMDCRSMEFEDETFDRVLDKGCMDTVLATEESERAVASYLSHVSRVLRPAGKFILVSLSPPSTNLPFLSNEDFSWSVECTELVKPVIGGEREKMNLSEDPKSAHYLYVCTMGNDCE